LKAISLLQPWGWLMLHGGKNIENRNWPTKFRGEILIHASKGWDKKAFALIGDGGEDALFIPQAFIKMPFLPNGVVMPSRISDFWRGGIIGSMTITDCVTESSSPWFFGPYGFTVENVHPLPYMVCNGALGIWEVPQDVMVQLALIKLGGFDKGA
jgi:hypothetical protein